MWRAQSKEHVSPRKPLLQFLVFCCVLMPTHVVVTRAGHHTVTRTRTPDYETLLWPDFRKLFILGIKALPCCRVICHAALIEIKSSTINSSTTTITTTITILSSYYPHDPAMWHMTRVWTNCYKNMTRASHEKVEIWPCWNCKVHRNPRCIRVIGELKEGFI